MTDEEPTTLLEQYTANRSNGKLLTMLKTQMSFANSTVDTIEINRLKSADVRMQMMEEIHKIMTEYPDDPIHLIYKEKTFPTPIYAGPVHCETVCTYYLLHG